MYGTPRLDSSWGAQALVGVSYLYEIRILHPRDLLRSIQTYNRKIPLVPRILLILLILNRTGFITNEKSVWRTIFSKRTLWKRIGKSENIWSTFNRNPIVLDVRVKGRNVHAHCRSLAVPCIWEGLSCFLSSKKNVPGFNLNRFTTSIEL